MADCAKHLEQWIYEMATHVKSLDQNHLVTVGMEGARELGWRPEECVGGVEKGGLAIGEHGSFDACGGCFLQRAPRGSASRSLRLGGGPAGGPSARTPRSLPIPGVPPSHHAGFWGTNDKMKANNPGGPQGLDWASKAGQDFIAQHVISVIDFATIHIWPDNWLT